MVLVGTDQRIAANIARVRETGITIGSDTGITGLIASPAEPA